MKKTEFTVEQYKALVADIEEKVFANLSQSIKKAMPPSHSTNNALYYAVLRLVTRTICTICDNDTGAKERALEDFCKTIPALVREARIVTVSADGGLDYH